MALEIKDDSTQSVKKSKKSMNRVHFILDESGSMSHARQSTIDGFNEYVNGLRHDKNGNSYKISLTKFEGGNIVRVFTDLNIKQVKDLGWEDYCPCGGTNLNDAIGFTMRDMEKNKIKGKHNTLVIILTDGYENSSREWKKETVAALITEKEKKDGWTVTFLGANIDTQAVSRDYAISIDNARSYTTKGMRSTMANLSTATAAYACSATVGSSMSNMMSESMSGVSEADWMATDDENDAQGVVNTGAASVDLSGLGTMTVTGLAEGDLASTSIVVEDAQDMGLSYDRSTGEYTNAAGSACTPPKGYGARDPKLLNRAEKRAQKLADMDKKLIDEDALQEAEDRFRKLNAVIRPSNAKGGTDNG